MEKFDDQSTWVPRVPEKGNIEDRSRIVPGQQEVPAPEKKKPVDPAIIQGILDKLDKDGFEKEDNQKKRPTIH